MPVSPADFYAYSQATGVPVPEDPQQRAQLAPQVMEFRRNQLRQQQEPSIDPLSAGVGIGLALAGAGAAGLTARRMLRSGKATGQAGTQITNLENLQRAAGKTKPTKQEAYRKAAEKPVEDLPPVSRPQGGAETELIVDTETGEVFRSGGGRPYAEAMTSADLAAQVDEIAQEVSQNALTDFQKRQAPALSDQQINAVESGEDQMTGRMRQQLQRDEDINLMEVDALEDLNTQNVNAMMEEAEPSQMIGYEADTPINQAAAQTADGIPFDQAEGITSSKVNRPLSESSAARFLARERDEIASELAEQGLPINPTRVEKELSNRLGSDAYLYGSKYTRRKQSLQLGATYDPELFENMAKPFVVIAGEKVPTGRVTGTKTTKTPYTGTSITEDVELGLRQPTYMEATAERLQEQAAKKRDWLGSVRLEEASKNARANAELINVNRAYNNLLDYKDEVVSSINSGNLTPEQRTRANQRIDDINYELDRLDVQSEELNQRVYGGQSGARVRGAEKYTEDYIENLVPPSRLKPGIEEGQRVFFEVDEFTGEPIPGTQEIRSERKMIDTAPKGGGGRNVAEFSAGTRDEGGVDLGNILQELRTPRNQSAREYEKDQFGYRPGTGLTGKALEGKPFTDDRTQTGRVITRTGIQKSGPQEGSMAAVVNPYTQLDDETLGMISLQGSEADAANASRILARRRREGYDPSTITGPGRSQRVVSSVSLTPEEKQTKISSMNVSQKLAALQKSGRPDAQQQVQKYLRELRGGA